jgi:hypothetical protein
VRPLLPEDQQLLSDQQLRDASEEQLQDLIVCLELMLRRKGQPSLTLHPPEDERDTPEPADPSRAALANVGAAYAPIQHLASRYEPS